MGTRQPERPCGTLWTTLGLIMYRQAATRMAGEAQIQGVTGVTTSQPCVFSFRKARTVRAT